MQASPPSASHSKLSCGSPRRPHHNRTFHAAPSVSASTRINVLFLRFSPDKIPKLPCKRQISPKKRRGPEVIHNEGEKQPGAGQRLKDDTAAQWIVEALELHEDSLVRYAAWMLRDLDLAREVVQETFLRLCREERSKVEGHIAQWLFTVCRNLAFDTRKREARMTPLEDTDIGVDSRLEQREAVGEIFRFVETLPKNQREVVYLKFQCDLSYKEISEVTKLSIGNVGFLLHHALAAIRKRLLSESARRRP